MVGGEITSNAEHPFVAYIATSSGSCTGSIITPVWILTAAHCVVDGDGSVDPASEVRIEHGYGSSLGHSRRGVIAVVAHPDYHFKGAGFKHDIVLIKVDSAFRREWSVPVADSAKESRYAPSGTYGSILGWGLKENDGHSDEIREGVAAILHPSLCRRQFTFVNETEVVHADTLCAATTDVHGNSGDSGGPLVVKYIDRGVVRSTQVGVTSMTADRNGQEQTTVFTRVSTHIGWIRETVERMEFSSSTLTKSCSLNLRWTDPETGRLRSVDTEGSTYETHQTRILEDTPITVTLRCQ